MAIVNGVVEGVSEKYGKFSVLVNGEWFGTKAEWAPKIKPNKGDTVQFDNGGGKFLKQLKIMGGSVGGDTPASSPSRPASGGSSGGRQFPVPPLAPERTINRQNALTAAVRLYCELVEDAFSSYSWSFPISSNTDEAIIEIARKFEAYTTGDLDLEEAQKAIEEAV